MKKDLLIVIAIISVMILIIVPLFIIHQECIAVHFLSGVVVLANQPEGMAPADLSELYNTRFADLEAAADLLTADPSANLPMLPDPQHRNAFVLHGDVFIHYQVLSHDGREWHVTLCRCKAQEGQSSAEMAEAAVQHLQHDSTHPEERVFLLDHPGWYAQICPSTGEGKR